VLDPAVFAAVAVVLGGVVAVAARDGRVVVLGLMLAAVAASLVASPLPNSLAVSARILGAMLAAYLLWAAVGSGSVSSAGSAIGLVAEGCVAVAAFAIGLAIAPVDPLAGPVEAQAAGLSMIALAVVPLIDRDVFRMGVGVTLLTLGGSLLVEAWSGPTAPLGQLAMAALLIGIAGSTSLLIPSAEAAEAAAERPGAPEASAEGAEAADAEQPAAQPVPAPSRVSAAHGKPFQVIVKPGSAAPVDSQPTRSIEPERRPRPMTADPIDPDDWLAWEALEPEHVRRPSIGAARHPAVASSAPTDKPAVKKPTRSRPNLHGKP
jgi:hypothetical protein